MRGTEFIYGRPAYCIYMGDHSPTVQSLELGLSRSARDKPEPCSETWCWPLVVRVHLNPL
jgi:hypothetical protein